MTHKTEYIWTCKIGGPAIQFQSGADAPMRQAVQAAFKQVTGNDEAFCFSGWGGELTEGERAVVENRLPRTPSSPATEPDERSEREAWKRETVLGAAREWSAERMPSDWCEADLMKAIIDLDGDWPGCDECDHQCDEPCTPATVAEMHARIDNHIADLVHAGKLGAYIGYTPPAGWRPSVRIKSEAPARALAAPTAPAPTEPVGWQRFDDISNQWTECSYFVAHGFTSDVPLPGFRAVYATPPSAADQPEAVCERCGVDQSKHSDPQHWCDNQSFTLAAAPTTEATSSPSDAEREAFNIAWRQTWGMVDPLRPPPAGTYYLGEHNGIIAALKTIRENFDAAIHATKGGEL